MYPYARWLVFFFRGVHNLPPRKMHHFRIRKIADFFLTVETAKPPIKSGVSWAISFSLPFDGGRCGIRTHVSVRTNGFQDRLVMTASITFRIFAPPETKRIFRQRMYFITSESRCQPKIFKRRRSGRRVSAIRGAGAVFFVIKGAIPAYISTRK